MWLGKERESNPGEENGIASVAESEGKRRKDRHRSGIEMWGVKRTRFVAI